MLGLGQQKSGGTEGPFDDNASEAPRAVPCVMFGELPGAPLLFALQDNSHFSCLAVHGAQYGSCPRRCGVINTCGDLG